MRPYYATLKLNSIKQKLVSGQFTAQVGQLTKMEVEVYHPEYQRQTYTIQMGKSDMVKYFQLKRYPHDKLKTIVVKNSAHSDDTNDLFYARVRNSVSSCTVNLDSWGNDFQQGNLDTFTDLNNAFDQVDIPGNCQDFNITGLTSLEVLHVAYHGIMFDKAEKWLGEYILLKSDRVKYKCTNNMHWIYADSIWHGFNCQLY